MVKKLTDYLSIFAIVSLCCGCIITNLYLSSLGILDYSLFSIQMIYCGTTFLGLLFTLILLSVVFSDYLQFEKTAWIDNFVNGCTRGTIIGNIFVMGSVLFVQYDKLAHWLITLSLLAMGGKALQYYCCLDKIYFFDEFMKWTNYFISLVVAGTIIYNIYDNYVYFNFVSFFAAVNFVLYAFRLNYSIRLFDRARGINITNPDFFSTNITENSRWSWKDDIFGIFAIIISVLILSYFYVENVYPFIYEKYGGGYKELVKYELYNDKALIGRTIKVTDNHIYILDNNNTIHIVKTDDVQRMKKM